MDQNDDKPSRKKVSDLKISDMSANQHKIRAKFIKFMEQYAWEKTLVHQAFENGEIDSTDAQFSKTINNHSTISLSQEYQRLLFEAEFAGYMLRLSTTNLAISHAIDVIEILPHLKHIQEIDDFLGRLLKTGVYYEIGLEYDFEQLSNQSIKEFIKQIQ